MRVKPFILFLLASMYLLAIKFPTGIRNASLTLQKIATNACLDTACFRSVICFPLFGLMSKNVVDRPGRAKSFNWEALPPMSPAFSSGLPTGANCDELLIRFCDNDSCKGCIHHEYTL